VRGNEEENKGKKKSGQPLEVPVSGPSMKKTIIDTSSVDQKLPEERGQVNSMQLALNAINAELGSRGVNISRGPETDIS
jgi:hypothetical protein